MVCLILCIAYSQRLRHVGQSVVIYIEGEIASGVQHIVIIFNVFSIDPGIFVLLLWRGRVEGKVSG